MTPIMPIGSIELISSISSINWEEKKNEVWIDYCVSRIFGLETNTKKEISLRNSFDSENSISTFQKMLKCAMEELNSDCILNAKGSEEHIDKINQTSFEKNYYENSRKEIIYWNNVLARMLDLNSNNNYI